MVQFQKDPKLYERIFAESSLYYYRNCSKFSDWQVVVIYPNRNTEQDNIFPHRSFLNGEQVHRIYLDELGDIHQLPLWVALMVLTIFNQEKAPEAARYLLSRSNQEASLSSNSAIIEIITTIMVYKFEKLSRREVESMLGITLKETRVYQEIKEEGREEGRIGEAANLIIRQITKRFGVIPEETHSLIANLSLPILEDLSEALLDFTNLADLQTWLNNVKH